MSLAQVVGTFNTMTPLETAVFLYDKGNNYLDKMSGYRMENFFINSTTNRGLIAQIYKKLNNDDNNKNKQKQN